jgi:geranylgeranyl pyrophosphate synthase
MKQLALPKRAPAAAVALARALGPGGPSALDPRVPAAVWQRALAGPAEEFLSRPGKQLRAALVRAGWMLAGGNPAAMPDRLSLVVELLHAGSLVIDDVQDGALDRRGAPALHQLIGVPLAINTGSWMYFWALAELAELGLSPATELAAHRAATTTLVRCHQGQALDLAIRVTDLSIAEVPVVVEAATRLKTGALCSLATSLGALVAGGDASIVAVASRFGDNAGVALQMLDDLGAIAASARRAKAHEDLRGARPTWPWAWLAESRVFAWGRLTAMLRAAGDPAALEATADALAAEVEPLGRERVRTLLAANRHELASATGDSKVLQAFDAELSRMEASYG